MMDGGLGRVPGRGDRGVAGRPEQVRRQPVATPPPQVETQQPVQRAAAYQAPQRQSVWRRWKLPLIILAAIIVLGLGAWFAWSQLRPGAVAIDGSKYQAVFFTNGQVYFGKLQSKGAENMILTDVYYLQSQQAGQKTDDSKNPQQSTSGQGDVQLIKLGNEVHGPEDEMIISKDQVLFYENLKNDGKVAQTIAQYKKSH